MRQLKKFETDDLLTSGAQSRQSAKLFLQSSELGLPQPLTRRRVCPPPAWFRGEGYTRWRERGWESPNSNEGTYTVVLFIYVPCVQVGLAFCTLYSLTYHTTWLVVPFSLLFLCWLGRHSD